MYSVLIRNFFPMMLGLSLVSLGAAFFVEYALGYLPCHLCIYQRWPYVVIMIVSLIAIQFKQYTKASVLLVLGAIAVSIGLSFFHAGVEMSLWDGLKSCHNQLNIPADLNLNQIRDFLNEAPVANCAAVSFRVLGLSMSEWNLIINLLLFFISFKFYRKIISTKNVAESRA
jgi:disulfide bond formation protein DsbB